MIFFSIFFALLIIHGHSHPLEGCEVGVRISSGCMCGVRRLNDDERPFVSFLGVPYARQPVGERRFKELEAVEPWDHLYDATTEGPICPQYDVVYGPLMTNRNMSEACIYANIHVPMSALPGYTEPIPSLDIQTPLEASSEVVEEPGLPILVFIHGGGFAYGSGSDDLHGPEFFMNSPREMILITFNYRLNVFGFLSLKSATIPGNNGLRDVITLLKWVKENAASFGGDPNNVTIAGQSAGAAMAHLLTLSTAAEGLFRRAIFMSGAAIQSFFSTSPAYAGFVANMLLSYLGINTTDPEEVHQKLIALPLETIMEANKQVQNQIGLVAFVPVVESSFPNVTTVVDDDPEILISKGRGIDIPLMVGFANAECETFRPNFEAIDILSLVKKNPILVLSPTIIYKTPPNIALKLADKVIKKYLGDSPTMDQYVKLCSDTYYVHPAIKLAEKRALMESAPVFLYQFSYQPDFSPIRETKGLKFKGACHIEDITNLFKCNSMSNTTGFSPPTIKDSMMRDWLMKYVARFLYCGDPTCNRRLLSDWPRVEKKSLQYLEIDTPTVVRFMEPTPEQLDMMQFFDNLQNNTS